MESKLLEELGRGLTQLTEKLGEAEVREHLSLRISTSLFPRFCAMLGADPKAGVSQVSLFGHPVAWTTQFPDERVEFHFRGRVVGTLRIRYTHAVPKFYA